jgi:hypothetical protein
LETRKYTQGFAVKLETERMFAGPRNRCKDIKINLKELGQEGMTWIHLAKERRQWREQVSL